MSDGGENEKIDSMLVMSGGEGYIDFRLGMYGVDFVALVDNCLVSSCTVVH